MREAVFLLGKFVMRQNAVAFCLIHHRKGTV